LNPESNVLLLDMDGVVVDCEKHFLDTWRGRYPDEFYVPLEKRATFWLEGQYPTNCHERIRQILNEPGFFLGMPPMAGAVNAVEGLRLAGYELFICTRPMPSSDTMVGEKIQWIGRHLGAHMRQRMFVVTDKTLVRGAWLLDDKPDAEHGLVTPTWEHVLFNQPYNRQVLGKRRADWTNWQSVFPKLP